MNTEIYQLLERKPYIKLLKDKIGGHCVYIYGDDAGDFAFGGNKVRFYECLIPELLKDKPDVLVTSGSVYSNHIRVSAIVAERLGIPCHILLTEDEGSFDETENLRLTRGYGAEIHAVGHFAVLLRINEYVDNLKADGKKVYLVPNGGHTPIATQAYKRVVSYALDKLEADGIDISSIFLPCASGTTHAGVLSAASVRKIPPVISFAVANKPKRAEKAIALLIDEAKSYNDGLDSSELTVKVLDSGKNNYGKPDEELLCLRKQLYDTDGILLDPTYNINAFFGMTEYLENNFCGGSVLYINTGGCTVL